MLNPIPARGFNAFEYTIKESGRDKEVAEDIQQQVIEPLERSHIQLKYNGAKEWSTADSKHRDTTLNDTTRWLIAAHKLYLQALPTEGFDDIRQRTNNEIEELSKQLETNRPIAVPRILNSREELFLVIQILDTRGYVHYRLKNFQIAHGNLTAAIDLATGIVRELERHENAPGKDRLEYLRSTLAIMHYHRAVVYESLGHVDFQKRDLEMVRHYGAEPNPTLF